MTKNIVFCADGTWNGPGEINEDTQPNLTSNVFKFYSALAGNDTPESLALDNERERVETSATGLVLQVAKYLHGVGDSNKYLVRMLGGGFGAGLIDRVVRGYTFLSRNYQTGDRIHLCGFSRGAYVVRALGGLIAAEGLLDATKQNLNDRQAAYLAGMSIWFDNRKQCLGEDQNLLGKLEELLVAVPAWILMSRRASAPPTIRVSIASIGVWDTVGSLGIPKFDSSEQNIEPLRFVDTKLSQGVEKGFHAVAMDERRGNFTPTLWDADPRVTQVLFPGAHSDVGGGYPLSNSESGLSDGALSWMIEQLLGEKVLFAQTAIDQINPNPLGVAHQPWCHPPYKRLPQSDRHFAASLGLKSHTSVLTRMSAPTVQAAPEASPAPYRPKSIEH
jgi:uncharacterized protein (DUF2235 family)